MFGMEPFGRRELTWGRAPVVDVAERENEYEITAELPGMEEKDIELTVSDDVLKIRGERKEEKEEKNKDYHISERRYGSYQRSFRLPEGVDDSKIEAKFKNGLLTVTLPKTAEAQKKSKKIEVKKG
jgi:HSP20 family protein